MTATSKDNIVAKAKNVLMNHWDGSLPLDSVKLATSLGMTVYARGQANDDFPISSRFRVYDGVPSIEFNATESLIHQRLSVALALSHYLLGHENPPVATENFYESQNSMQQEAMLLSRELIMPREMVSSTYNAGTAKDLNALAQCFGVSPDALGHRLIQLELV